MTVLNKVPRPLKEKQLKLIIIIVITIVVVVMMMIAIIIILKYQSLSLIDYFSVRHPFRREMIKG